MGPLLLLLSLPLYVLATPAPELLQRRSLADTLSDLLKDLQTGVNASDILQGILPDFWRDLPGTDKIKKQLGLDDNEIARLPFEFLDVPFVPPLGSPQYCRLLLKFRC